TPAPCLKVQPLVQNMCFLAIFLSIAGAGASRSTANRSIQSSLPERLNPTRKTAPSRCVSRLIDWYSPKFLSIHCVLFAAAFDQVRNMTNFAPELRNGSAVDRKKSIVSAFQVAAARTEPLRNELIPTAPAVETFSGPERRIVTGAICIGLPVRFQN